MKKIIILLFGLLSISCSSLKVQNDFILKYSFAKIDLNLPDRTIEYNSENGKCKFKFGSEISELILPLSQSEKETLLQISSKNFNMCIKFMDKDFGNFYTNYKLKFKNQSGHNKCKEGLSSEESANSKEVLFYYKLLHFLKQRPEYKNKFPGQFETA